VSLVALLDGLTLSSQQKRRRRNKKTCRSLETVAEQPGTFIIIG
jgi:hypothetical protein